MSLPLVRYIDAGKISYTDAWNLQDQLFNEVTTLKLAQRKGETGGAEKPSSYLITCEHPHVITLGKSGNESHLLLNENELSEQKTEFVKTNRGGDITYHGPGQLVGYPILDLDQFFTDIHKYLRFLEEVIIRTLQTFGIDSGRIQGLTGVWVDYKNPEKARKICAFGVRTSRWVTMHGWALNISPDLNRFNYIIPCGIMEKEVTSMEKELGKAPDFSKVTQEALIHFAEVFECRIIKTQLHEKNE
jgi:lipoyl(octanoyl) transferase